MTAPSTEATPRYRILVADDNPVNRLAAVRLLQRRGHDVTAVTDGRAAVEAAATQPFDAILMDVEMPGLDGLSATAQIRAAHTDSALRVPILALTAHADPADHARCLAAGMDACLVKPIVAETVVETIRQLRAAAELVARARTETSSPSSPSSIPEPWKAGHYLHRGVYGVCVRDGAVLAIRKSRGPYTGHFDLPGGTPEPTETPTATLLRELHEETGAHVIGSGPWADFAVCCIRDTDGLPVRYEHHGRWCSVELHGIDFTRPALEDVAEIAWIPLENWRDRPDLSVALRAVLAQWADYLRGRETVDPDATGDGTDGARSSAAEIKAD